MATVKTFVGSDGFYELYQEHDYVREAIHGLVKELAQRLPPQPSAAGYGEVYDLEVYAEELSFNGQYITHAVRGRRDLI